jgi:hypothetical protein
MAETKSWKLVVVGIPIKRTRTGRIRIMTQLRMVQNPSYDPISHKTWEAIGETVKEEDGTILATLERGFLEECGLDKFDPLRVYGGSVIEWTTGKQYAERQDRQHCHQPFRFLQNLDIPQPWVGPCFVVEFSPDWEPDYSKSDHEGGGNRWWSAEELKKAIKENPGTFACFHHPAFAELCDAIIEGVFD